MTKPKVASDWLAGCSGCHMSLLDIDERIVTLVEVADLRATPITDLKEPDESGVAVGVLEGGVNNSANEEVAHRMRKPLRHAGGAGRLCGLRRRSGYAQLLQTRGRLTQGLRGD